MSLVVPGTVLPGTGVPISIRVSNTTTAPVDLYLRGREIAFDIVITDSAGDDVWRRLEGEIVPAILQLRPLGPGEVLELNHEWDQRTRLGEPVPAGVYSIRGFVLTDGETSLVSKQASVAIEP